MSSTVCGAAGVSIEACSCRPMWCWNRSPTAAPSTQVRLDHDAARFCFLPKAMMYIYAWYICMPQYIEYSSTWVKRESVAHWQRVTYLIKSGLVKTHAPNSVNQAGEGLEVRAMCAIWFLSFFLPCVISR